MRNNWNEHYRKIQKNMLPPSATLVKALELFGKEQGHIRIASDLGCGTGIDSIEMIEKGWEVISIDKQQKAVELLKKNIPEIYKSRLKIITGDFENIHLPMVLLVNASFSLPFCRPENFNSLWNKVRQSVLPGGRFAGHFFGVHDSWAGDPEKTFHTKDDVLKLCNGFKIEYLEEVEMDGKTISGQQKHWHVFHVVARKL